MLRSAQLEDLGPITALLADVGLPTRGVDAQLSNFLVFESGTVLTAVGGLELYESDALLRSLAVSPAHRGQGQARRICDRLEAEAAHRGVGHVYVLTETAETFFAGRGYEVVARALAPAVIAASEEFAAICPQSATLMRRRLMRRPGGPA